MINVIDDFLPIDYHKHIYDIIMDETFPWYFRGTAVTTENDISNYLFTHALHAARKEQSSFFQNFLPMLEHIPNFAALIRAKINLNTKAKDVSFPTGWHVDFPFKSENCYTALYYINDSDGVTEFETGDFVEPKENRIVIFPTQLKHQGYTPHKNTRRCNININYFTDNESQNLY
jgi:hypothetical protein